MSETYHAKSHGMPGPRQHALGACLDVRSAFTADLELFMTLTIDQLY